MSQNFGGMDSAINNSKPMIQQRTELPVYLGDHHEYQNAINYNLVYAVVFVCIFVVIFVVVKLFKK